MSSPENMSKRERQKQRREAKLVQQRAAQAKARRTRLLTFAVLGVVVAGAIGAFAYGKYREDQLEEQRRADVLAKLDELGCTEVQDLPDQNAGHFSGEELAATPPDVAYPDRPATSGKHFGNWLMTGVYDQFLDERALVHNLEHGYILGYFTDDADEGQVESFKAFAQEQIDGKYPKIIVSRWDGDLPEDASFAYVAWNHRQLCDEFDEDVFATFANDFHSSNGDAPDAEKGIAPHLKEGSGTIDPGEEPFELPPLGNAAPPTEGSMDPASESTS